MKAVITGLNGFIGAHLCEHLLKNTDWDIVGFDKMSSVSKSNDRLMDMDTWDKYKHRVKAYPIDLNLPVPKTIADEIGPVDYIFHLAAESHVDRSISEPMDFVVNNVKCTINILEYAKTQPLKMFINFSTDEVYGPAPVGTSFKEFDQHNPTNPYAASKSAQEQLGKVWANCWGVPVLTTHTMNVIGERQHPEKFVPMVIRRVLNGEVVTIHSDKTKTKAGTRFYIHARNVADALLHIVGLGYHGYDEWNIAGLEELDNLTLAQKIAQVVGKELKYEMTDFHSSRPGHDLRYALDSSKLIASGYQYPKSLQESLEKTINWTVDRKDEWL